jgi:hypothetical protein
MSEKLEVGQKVLAKEHLEKVGIAMEHRTESDEVIRNVLMADRAVSAPAAQRERGKKG